ncbi:MAG: rhodanese-like domain-containing protein [Flavobacteriales bacterium]|nr:rhodanese-like domain-containing protein [Flavobacteriales bacterium]
MQDITVEELYKRLQSGENIHVIDVREPWEYEEFNINGKLIPLGSLQGAIDDLDEWKDDEIVVHCRSGQRSAAAKDFMIRQGFKNVRNLLGGMMAWQDLARG